MTFVHVMCFISDQSSWHSLTQTCKRSVSVSVSCALSSSICYRIVFVIRPWWSMFTHSVRLLNGSCSVRNHVIAFSLLFNECTGQASNGPIIELLNGSVSLEQQVTPNGHRSMSALMNESDVLFGKCPCAACFPGGLCIAPYPVRCVY